MGDVIKLRGWEHVLAWGAVCLFPARGFGGHSEETGLVCDPHHVSVLHEKSVGS